MSKELEREKKGTKSDFDYSNFSIYYTNLLIDQISNCKTNNFSQLKKLKRKTLNKFEKKNK